MNPFLDTSGLTDKEIDDKIADINKKILIVSQSSNNIYLLDQLRLLRDTLYSEMNERYEREMLKLERGPDLETGGYPTGEENGKERW